MEIEGTATGYMDRTPHARFIANPSRPAPGGRIEPPWDDFSCPGKVR